MTITDIKVTLLEKAVEWITGGEAFELVKKVVDSLMSADMSGEEKLAQAKAIIYPALKSMAPFIINMLIEVAVFILKSQIPQTEK